MDNVVLEAMYEDGEKACGESHIPNSRKRIKQVVLKPSDAKPLDEALEAIQTADAIILGPGSLYTSLIPNLLVKDITLAISKAKAKKIYVVNVMTQPGETDGYSASDHVRAVIDHSSPDVMDFVIINSGEIPDYLLSRYLSDGSTPVKCDREVIEAMGYKVVAASVINPTDVVRHSPELLAKVIMDLI